MKKKMLYIILLLCLTVNGLLTYFVFIPYYKDYQIRAAEKKEAERIKNATIIVELKEERSIPFYTKDTYASSYIDYINGEITKDVKINTEKVGEQEVTIEYINDEDIKIPYTFTITVKDITAPSIWLNSSYTVNTGYQGNIAEDITCIDDYDDHPKCSIEGIYDTETPGTYPVTFVAEDASGNVNKKNFNIIVKNKSESSTSTPQEKVYTETLFTDVIDKYKNENTKIGIDVSRWQGDINYQAVKDAGVEFVFIKVGGTIGIDGEYYVDKKFIQNIEGFNEVGIPVGVYIYTYAHDEKTAIEDAEWILEQIKPYKVDLPIVYDWENWGDVMEFKQSLWSLTRNAKIFLDRVAEDGYSGMLYSSKNYLEKAWLELEYDTWLAHYTEQTTYQGKYKYWQLCEDGIIDGIDGKVDIDVMYINK